MKYQKSFIGKDSLRSLGEELKMLCPKRILMFHGRKSYEQCGAKESIDKILSEFPKTEIVEFSDFSVNPEFNDLHKALKQCEEFQPDLILAVGGGSALDMAKLTRFLDSYNGEVESGKYIKRRDLIPLIAIPTTAGTGAEATHFAVLYKGKIKYSVEHDDVLPDIAVVYPPFTYKNSPYLTACTGFDALAQAIEAFWNKNATGESDNYAKRAIELIYPNLPLAVNAPSDEIRDKMAEGSYWAGRAINITKTTAPHAFSYGLTSLYGYPHGHAVAIFFPKVMKFNLQKEWNNDTKKHQLATLLQCNSLQQCCDMMCNLIDQVKLNKKDQSYDINKLMEGINLSRLSNNPALFSNEDIHKIYSSSLLK